MEGGAYGAGKASSGGLNPAAIITKPQVILRGVAWLFSIIVFGCIANQGWNTSLLVCFYNGDVNACNFGITIGVFSFLACMGFLVVDVLFDNLSNVQMRKYAVVADLAFSGLWTFMWFVCFCYLTDAWRKTSPFIGVAGFYVHGPGQAKAAIAFSFFSIIPWAGLTVLAFMRFRQGSQAAFSQSYEPDPSVPPPAAQVSGGDSYQQPPFTEKTAVPDSQFQAPTY